MSLTKIINKRDESIDPYGVHKDDLAISDFVKFSLIISRAVSNSLVDQLELMKRDNTYALL